MNVCKYANMSVESWYMHVVVRTSFVARVSHEAISEVEPLSTDI